MLALKKKGRYSAAMPREVERIAERLGTNIETARLRRRWRQTDLASKAGITRATLASIEKGKTTAGIGAYLAALWALGLDDQLKSLADPSSDAEGITLESSRANKRARPRVDLSDDF